MEIHITEQIKPYKDFKIAFVNKSLRSNLFVQYLSGTRFLPIDDAEYILAQIEFENTDISKLVSITGQTQIYTFQQD